MELVTAICAPIVTGLITLIGIIITNRKQQAISETKAEMREAEYKEHFARLEQKVDEHNNYAALFHKTVAEQNVTLARIDERLKVLEDK